MTAFARVSTQIFRRTSSQYSITACCCRRGTYLNPQRSMMIHPLLRYSSSSHHWSDVEDWFSLRDALVRSHPLKYAPAKVDGVTSYKGKVSIKLYVCRQNQSIR